MKKLISVFFTALLLTTSFAQKENKDDDTRFKNIENTKNNNGNYNSNSAMQVSSYTQNKLVVTIDNYLEYESNNSNGAMVVTIGDLMAGNHNITIYEIKKGFFGSQRKQIYSSSLFLKAAYETIINIAYNGQVSIQERALYTSGGNNGNNGCGNGYGYGRKNKYRKHGHNNNGNNQNNYPTYNRQMSTYDFEQLKQFIKKEAFDDRKVAIAKQGAGNYYFSTYQVREIMNIFSFDNGKLEIAKYFYSRSVDKNNYYQLADALSFSSSKDELLAYIK
jgi:uncharacterized FlaG/YvyC family protein